jgi:hypothetical protein
VKRTCRRCGRLFTPRANVLDQQYCSRRVCQNARRQRWRKQKLLSDPDYRANQYDAQKRWCEKNPDYWNHYRASHPAYRHKNRQLQTERNKKRTLARVDTGSLIAKRYVSKDQKDIISGIYRLVPVNGAMIAKSDAYFVKLNLITGS